MRLRRPQRGTIMPGGGGIVLNRQPALYGSPRNVAERYRRRSGPPRQPLPVTSREREIASLIAAGLSNREIAERLTVSVRTVEGHIYRACIKLDVTDRDELGNIVSKDLKK